MKDPNRDIPDTPETRRLLRKYTEYMFDIYSKRFNIPRFHTERLYEKLTYEMFKNGVKTVRLIDSMAMRIKLCVGVICALSVTATILALKLFSLCRKAGKN